MYAWGKLKKNKDFICFSCDISIVSLFNKLKSNCVFSVIFRPPVYDINIPTQIDQNRFDKSTFDWTKLWNYFTLLHRPPSSNGVWLMMTYERLAGYRSDRFEVIYLFPFFPSLTAYARILLAVFYTIDYYFCYTTAKAHALFSLGRASRAQSCVKRIMRAQTIWFNWLMARRFERIFQQWCMYINMFFFWFIQHCICFLQTFQLSSRGNINRDKLVVVVNERVQCLKGND